MRLLGDKLKQYRKQKNLSQQELAEGICTQATVSLMEKKNKVPSIKIILQICRRLNVSLEDILAGMGSGLDDQFSRISRAVRFGDYHGADRLLDQMDMGSVQNAFDRERYHYYRGFVEIGARQRPDEAIFHFNLLLHRSYRMPWDLYAIVGNVGMAAAYLERKEYEKVHYYLREAMTYLDSYEWHEEEEFKRLVWARYRIAQLYLQLEQPQLVNENVEAALQVVKQQDSLYLIDVLYELKGQAEQALLATTAAKRSLAIAQTLAVVTHNVALQQRLGQTVGSLLPD
ncbi:helix-turn-helix transcriptional regulator [Levilactobacillus zymae]|uniref:Transcriptional regulator n=1 Tax=Levilactobacillus zymae TaxID=267363 RepID=A0A1Y6JXU0_9LACO|nr:helix-turn-helix transcriptional regulator [Levilactobacillus zymae]KRL10634.1 XRE family transcriptional regulator [Levilactobacillus zymae DSM 19395]QFR60312.1 helix-turn-helix domain-containing protein [Levilactobacillus zymae]GEO71239.1 transcriptional regulator [Levilactobacillus zymae]SMS14665.1 Transcriptional regulator, xre family [Levilactobacillus zymae]